MKNKVLLLFLAFLSFSCFEEEEDAPGVLPSGTYVGTFTRSSPTALYPSSDVTLVLQDQSFSGSSSLPQYPAIGKGTYRVQGQEVVFKDESFWTANFDWTLILDGTFTLATDAQGGITLTRRRGDISDVYMLTRQPGGK
ncbi:hypothetical protein ACD591_15890 [Rufibacter glacialis]|uniref:Lipocalin-like domain-containing protein n=1 Tax=Rufibacter glacialis TaxID=1259555 RepID=A0A5M8QR92_9BACT|nr:hypothetical protein [Rufibacter glacialis]KAA6437570.1 hypothetical protein FOE74_03450 [Rufibacter glacialis]GGK58243.1 hypothetical protein GCM10011405_02860 [Rufibacter glacialis]